MGTRLPFRGGRMAHAGGTGYDNREIVMKYIHYKLSQRGYEWDAGDAGAAPPGAAPAPGTNLQVTNFQRCKCVCMPNHVRPE